MPIKHAINISDAGLCGGRENQLGAIGLIGAAGLVNLTPMRKRGLLLLLAAAACVGPSEQRHGRRHMPSRPPEPNLRMCLADLRSAGAKFELLPDRVFSPGCSAVSSVKLIAVGIPVTNLGAVRCGLAVPFTQWVQTAVQQSARAWLDSPVARIESFGSYACRPVNNMAGNKLSEHASANAVDISGFVLANGRRITVKQDWNGPDANARNFLRALHQSACRRFRVVLGPNANALHQDHFHFDMGPWPYCR
jgi:hypothetical protein